MYLANYIKDHRVGMGIMTIATIVIATSWVALGHQAKRPLLQHAEADQTNQSAAQGLEATGGEVTINGQTFDVPDNSSVQATSDGSGTTVTSVTHGKAVTQTVPSGPDASGNIQVDLKSSDGGQSSTSSSHQTYFNSYSSSHSSSQGNSFVYSNGNASVQTSK